MPEVTKTLGNNKVRAWESPDFAHKKEGGHIMTRALKKSLYTPFSKKNDSISPVDL